VGDIIEQEEFEKMMKVVKYCGEKLHNINQEIKEIKKTWQGDEVFKI
jgi:exonuclease VII small subunit